MSWDRFLFRMESKDALLIPQSYIKEEVLTKFAPLLDGVSPKQSL